MLYRHSGRALGFMPGGPIMPAQPLMPPPGATSERLITSDRTGQANKEICEGSGGTYIEYCPSHAQTGAFGPVPLIPPAGGGAAVPFQVPCVSHCEMPSGLRASAGQERPGTQWDPALTTISGLGAEPSTTTQLAVGAAVTFLAAYLTSKYVFKMRGKNVGYVCGGVTALYFLTKM